MIILKALNWLQPFPYKQSSLLSWNTAFQICYLKQIKTQLKRTLKLKFCSLNFYWKQSGFVSWYSSGWINRYKKSWETEKIQYSWIWSVRNAKNHLQYFQVTSLSWLIYVASISKSAPSFPCELISKIQNPIKALNVIVHDCYRLSFSSPNQVKLFSGEIVPLLNS